MKIIFSLYIIRWKREKVLLCRWYYLQIAALASGRKRRLRNARIHLTLTILVLANFSGTFIHSWIYTDHTWNGIKDFSLEDNSLFSEWNGLSFLFVLYVEFGYVQTCCCLLRHPRTITADHLRTSFIRCQLIHLRIFRA